MVWLLHIVAPASCPHVSPMPPSSVSGKHGEHLASPLIHNNIPLAMLSNIRSFKYLMNSNTTIRDYLLYMYSCTHIYTHNLHSFKCGTLLCYSNVTAFFIQLFSFALYLNKRILCLLFLALVGIHVCI